MTERQAAEQTRDLARDTKVLTNEHRAQTQILLASNPALSALTRTMSTFGGVARTALSITNALNLATLAFGQSSDTVAQIEGQIVELQRQKMRAKTSDEKNLIDEEIAQKEREKTAAAREYQLQQIQNGITAVASGALTVEALEVIS